MSPSEADINTQKQTSIHTPAVTPAVALRLLTNDKARGLTNNPQQEAPAWILLCSSSEYTQKQKKTVATHS